MIHQADDISQASSSQKLQKREPKAIFTIKQIAKKGASPTGLPAEARAFCACPEGPAKHMRVAGRPSVFLNYNFCDE